MTREEAREWFKNALWNNDFFPETEDAFKVAIESLSADTVSRSQYQGLLNAIDKVYVEVVRCKDCRHRYISGNGTTNYYVCDFMDAQYTDDGYCHHGERKEP